MNPVLTVHELFIQVPCQKQEQKGKKIHKHLGKKVRRLAAEK